MNREQKTAGLGLALSSVLTASFVAWLWIMTDRFLFVAWEPGIPGCEVYHSWNGYGYALWMLFVPLCWVTVPVSLLLAYSWTSTVARLKQGKTIANNVLKRYRLPLRDRRSLSTTFCETRRIST